MAGAADGSEAGMSTRRENGEGSKPIQRKDGRWQINLAHVDQDGRQRRTSITGRTEAEVRRKRKEVAKRIAAGQPARDKKVTLDDWVEKWITGALAVSDRKESTKAMYATVARKHITGSCIGGHTLDKLRPSSVETWLVELRTKGLSQSTVRSAYAILRAILDTAVRDGDLGVNPVAAVKRPKVDQSEAHYLTPGQVQDLLDAAHGSRYAPMFTLLVNTGMRRGEALALRWTDVDFDEGLVRVRGTLSRVAGDLVVTAPKTAKSVRVIPLSSAAADLLKAVRLQQKKERLAAGSQWRQTGFVFTTELGEPCDPRNALRALKAAQSKHNRAMDQAIREARGEAERSALGAQKLPPIGLHTLRHSAASIMLSNGVPLKVVSELLGHASVAITGDVYGHVSPDVSRDAVAKLGAALGA